MIDYDSITVTEATKLQKELRDRIQITPFDGEVKLIAGADVSFNRFSNIVYAGVIVMSFPDMEIVRTSLVKTETHFPYMSGYLAFREMPALQKAWDQLDIKPDVLILDGQGITHPRKLGIATHFGIINDQPTIGCAKTSLYGNFVHPDIPKHSVSPILGKEGEHTGYVLRTKNAVKPIFVSPGHLTDPDSALEIVMQTCGAYRIPEPTRLAHLKVNLCRTGEIAPGLYSE